MKDLSEKPEVGDASGSDTVAYHQQKSQPVSKQDWWQAPWFRTWLDLAGH